jgi:hypothetical protein
VSFHTGQADSSRGGDAGICVCVVRESGGKEQPQGNKRLAQCHSVYSHSYSDAFTASQETFLISEVLVPSADPSLFPTALSSNHLSTTATIMRALNHLICLFVLATFAWERPIETSTTITKQRCNVGRYSTYRNLMGDTIDYMDWVQESFSHQNTADDLCVIDQCLGCPFCSTIPQADEAATIAQTNTEARIKSENGEAISCMDCQSYLSECQRTSYPNEDVTSTQKAFLACELALCNSGPLHCRTGGECECRICKDLLAPNQAPDCNVCFKPWIECIHDLCLSPTHDAYADRPASLNCYKQDQAQCTQYSWQELSTSPKAFCTTRCWANTPSHCHAGGRCAHTEYSSSDIDFNSHPLTPSEYSSPH